MRLKINADVFKEIKRKLKVQSRKEIQYDYELSKTTVHYLANSPTYKDYKRFIELSWASKRNLT